MKTYSKLFISFIFVLVITISFHCQDETVNENPTSPGILLFGDSVMEGVFVGFDDLSTQTLSEELGPDFFTSFASSDSSSFSWANDIEDKITNRKLSYGALLAGKLGLEPYHYSKSGAEVSDLKSQTDSALKDKDKFRVSKLALVAYVGNDLCSQENNTYTNLNLDANNYAERFKTGLTYLIEKMEAVHKKDFKIIVAPVMDISFLLSSSIENMNSIILSEEKSCKSWREDDLTITVSGNIINIGASPFAAVCPALFSTDALTPIDYEYGDETQITDRATLFQALTEEYTSSLTIMLNELAEENDLTLGEDGQLQLISYNTFTLDETTIGPDCFHPNEEGQKQAADFIYTQVE